MRLHILSDLHLEFGEVELPVTNADAVILAGDTAQGVAGVQWAARTFPDKLVLFVAGNHEFYNHNMTGTIDELREAAQGTTVLVLENERVTLGGVEFFGCTLWTDFNLLSDASAAMRVASDWMNDYRLIHLDGGKRRIQAEDVLAKHHRSLAWLGEALACPLTGPRVVITHHAPSTLSLPLGERQRLVRSAYASNLDDLIKRSAATLWVHGHVHPPVDYHIGATRVVSNPRGYRDQNDGIFQPGLVIEI